MTIKTVTDSRGVWTVNGIQVTCVTPEGDAEWLVQEDGSLDVVNCLAAQMDDETFQAPAELDQAIAEARNQVLALSYELVGEDGEVIDDDSDEAMALIAESVDSTQPEGWVTHPQHGRCYAREV